MKKTIFEEVPIMNLIRFTDNLQHIYVKDIALFEHFPHDDITTDEKIQFIELKEIWNEMDFSDLREFFRDDAKAHYITGDW